MISQKNIQGSEFPMPRELTSHVGAGDISVVQDPKKSVKPSTKLMPPPPPLPPPRSLQKPSTDGMPPPPSPPRSLHKPSTDGMPPPPPPLPPPKFNSAMKMNGVNEGIQRPNLEAVPGKFGFLCQYDFSFRVFVGESAPESESVLPQKLLFIGFCIFALCCTIFLTKSMLV